MEPLLGQVVLFSGNFAPRGWAFCDGQLMEIASNEALFAILGTTYGGDGFKTFGIPDLRGRVPMHAGVGPALSKRVIGQTLGSERSKRKQTNCCVNTATHDVVENTAPFANSGIDDNMQPTLCMNYIIALEGMFPRRN